MSQHKTTVTAANLGFPYIGASRELKKHVEAYWAGRIDEGTLYNEAKKLRAEHWRIQRQQGIAAVPVGDFTLYDRVLDAAVDFGVIPQRYAKLSSGLEQYFAIARGFQGPPSISDTPVDLPASEMKKWFDTNYHYIVPEFERTQQFSLQRHRLVEEFKEAKAAGFDGRPVLLGPVSFLALGKAVIEKGGEEPFHPITLLPSLLPVYEELLQLLAEAGAEWVQIDEPVLVLDTLTEEVKSAVGVAYERLRSLTTPRPKVLLATYFGSVDVELLAQVIDLVDGLHVDVVRGGVGYLDEVLALILARVEQKKSSLRKVSLGVVNGRNVWKNDLAASIGIVKNAAQDKLRDGGVAIEWEVAPSCSLLHSPFSLEFEKGLPSAPVFSWLAFAVEKCREVALIARAVSEGTESVREEVEDNRRSLEGQKASPYTFNPEVRKRVEDVKEDDYRRASPYAVRQRVQQEKLKLPLFPTTTIGSFPQTTAIRVTRQKYTNGTLDRESYDEFIRKEIKAAVEFQERVGLDVFVHGESERTDMVEHFGRLLEGFAFTENGWVVSYGSRCVKPPIIFGDVSRPAPMTVDLIRYAQSLTSKPMKGMLTGPVTMLKWSFLREDIPASDLCRQMALALRDEVTELEAAGIPCIQVDEPAIREGLPLRREQWPGYLDWAVGCFKLCTSGVRDDTQIHTHMCYSDFNDIFDAIQALDADVLTIENAKSDMKLLKIFEVKQYTNGIGPGIYDVHAPRVPSLEEMTQTVDSILRYIPEQILWINPDCGLKSRGWKEVEAALLNLVETAKVARSTIVKPRDIKSI